MAVKVKIEPISREIDLLLDASLSPAARSQAVAAFARSELSGTLAANRKVLGSETPYQQFVDGRRGAALETVNPDRGVIVFEFELIQDVVRWVRDELIRRSPVGPPGGAGSYRESHRLFADGIEIDPYGPLPPATEYSFTNPVPYSREIEVGKTKSGRQFTLNVANYRPYDRVSFDAAKRFSNIAKIAYTFRGIVDGRQVNQRQAAATVKQRTVVRGANGRFAAGTRTTAISGGEHNRKKLRFPTIIIWPR